VFWKTLKHRQGWERSMKRPGILWVFKRFRDLGDWRLVGSLESCAAVVKDRGRRINNPPQINNLPHKGGFPKAFKHHLKRAARM
jgi:hypothetical protein